MKKLIIPGTILVLLVAGGAAWFLTKDNQSNNATQTDATPTATPLTSGVNEINYSPSDPGANDDINKQKESGSVAPAPAINTGINASITRADQATDGTLQVRILVSGTTSGTCDMTATLEGGATKITKSAVVAIKGTYSTCDGFDIPKSELSNGNWTVRVTVSDSNGTSEADTQAVTIN